MGMTAEADLHFWEDTGMAKKFGLRLKWLGCACFEMDFGGFTVVNDPWITDNKKTDLTWESVERCDIITVTHTHFDHITDIPALVEKFRPRMLAPQLSALSLVKYSDICPMHLYPMNPGLELDFDAVKIQAIFGRHTVLGPTFTAVRERAAKRPEVWDDPLMREMALIGGIEYLNFLYTMPDGTKVLIWGNELTPDQCNILRQIKPDIALLQMTKNSPEKTAQLCAEMGCSVVIPNHIDFPGDYSHLVTGLAEELKKYAPDVTYIVPEYGKWIEM